MLPYSNELNSCYEETTYFSRLKHFNKLINPMFPLI